VLTVSAKRAAKKTIGFFISISLMYMLASTQQKVYQKSLLLLKTLDASLSANLAPTHKAIMHRAQRYVDMTKLSSLKWKKQYQEREFMNAERWALVTGASAGIGKQFCELLAEQKWNLVLVARREPLLKGLKDELEKKHGIQVVILKADLLDINDITHVVEGIKAHKVTFLINNAGMLSRGEFHKKDLSEANRVVGLNITSLLHLTHGAVNFFKTLEQDCYILNLGSLNSFISTAEQAVYCGSKAFVKSFSLALAEELRGTNIKVSCLCPGGTESEILTVAGVELNSKGQGLMMKAQDVAMIGLKGARKGRMLVVPGWYNNVSAFMARLVPEGLMTSLSSKIVRGAVKLKDD
jgi:short-subunit dehydrogenase